LSFHAKRNIPIFSSFRTFLAMRIFLMGGTGLVGSRLMERLRQRQDEIVLLTRRPDVGREKLAGSGAVVEGDPTVPGPWMERIAECEAVINLVGENIFARRWNEDFKKLLYESRIKAAEHVAQALTKHPRTASGAARVLVNASAIGYYGPRGDEELTEDSPPGDDFLARVCVDWEKAARAAEPAGVRVAVLRIGVVLDRRGGALAQMLTPFKMFVGGPVGSGRQWLSWVHHQDVVGLILVALDNVQACGPINATAPNPVTNREFSKALGRALGRPSFLRTPKFALRALMGQVADVVTTGQRVLPRRAQALGYVFQFPEVDTALRDVLA
jgi:uncharacterized protein (TIGR01777 family)